MNFKTILMKTPGFIPDSLKKTVRKKHYKSVEYQYWQRSKIPSMHFQPSLPQLPVPKLEDTSRRYLAAQKPLLSSDRFFKTSSIVKTFNESSGKDLQAQLIEINKRNKHTSYISEPWFDMYLSDRKSLPLNYNPMLIFHNDPKNEFNDQLLKSANMLISSARFYKSLHEGFLEPEVFHMNPKKSDTEAFRKICSIVPSFASWYVAYLYNAYPLDMSQYQSLFFSTRIPEICKDYIFHENNSKHVLVQKNGHFYTFDVFDKSGYIMPPEKILANLHIVLNDSTKPEEFPLGILTTLQRNKWASLRTHLLSLGNEKQLKKIDGAFFNICLDDEDVNLRTAKKDEHFAQLTRLFLHGDGKNRWFDKSFSLLISKDGVAGLNFEHSWGDGIAVLRYFQDIHQDSIENPKVTLQTQPDFANLNKPEKLEFNLDDKIKTEIKDSIQKYQNTCKNIDINVLQLEGIGKKECKILKLSPDAIMQLGFQDAFYKLEGKCIASYESCSTAAFKHGRTETVRPCTVKTKAYSKIVNSKQFSKLEAFHLIKECSKYHLNLTKEAAMGQGFDRHLLVLKLLSEKNKIEADIFKDSAYNSINHNIISTSTLTSPRVLAGGFGPPAYDGFGIGYSMKENSVGMLVTNNTPVTLGKDYIHCLEKSFKNIRDIIINKLKNN